MAPSVPEADLSRRELDVLRPTAQGFSNKGIAARIDTGEGSRRGGERPPN